MRGRYGRPVVAEAVLPISVVIPVFDRAATVARAVGSALAQRPIAPAEVIVVDDGSADDSAARADAAGARVIRQDRNQGVAAARNRAVRAATQDWIALLDSDDEWLPGHLADLWPRRAGHVILGATAVTSGGTLIGCERETPVELATGADLLRSGNALVASTVLARRDALLAAGLFRDGMSRGEDLDLWLRVLETGSGLVSPTVTVRYAIHPGQASDARDSMRAAHREIVRTYRDRAWCSPTVVARSDAILDWDELRAEFRAGHRTRAAGAAARLLADPRKLAGVAELLLARARMRRRARAHRPA
jgi:glycosyltransferase involved in cell wall biosynthesis